MKIFLIGVVLSTTLLFVQCDIGEIANDFIDVIEDGISTIEGESNDWSETIQSIINQLPEDLAYLEGDLAQLLAEGTGMVASNLSCVAEGAPGRMILGLQNIIAELEGRPQTQVISTICGSSLNEINLSDPSNQRETIIVNGYDFSQENMKVYLKNGSNEVALTSALLFQSNYQATIVLTSLEDDYLEGFGYIELRYNDVILSQFPILGEAQDPFEMITFQPDALEHLCPVNVGLGDNLQADPYAEIKVEISIVGKEIWASVYLRMEETENVNETLGELYFDVEIWPGAGNFNGKEIISLESDTYSETNYIDTDGSPDLIELPEGELVSHFILQTSTSQADLGDCDIDYKSWASVYFNTIEFKLEK